MIKILITIHLHNEIFNYYDILIGVWLKNTQDFEKITQKEMKNTQN
jgi:hypothetical protein